MIQDFPFLALAVWRVVNLICNETGPFAMFARLRDWTERHEEEHPESILTKFHIHDLNSCEYCLSVWVGGLTIVLYALPVTRIPTMWVAYALSLSTTTILLKYVKHLLENVQLYYYVKTRMLTDERERQRLEKKVANLKTRMVTKTAVRKENINV